jgi:CRP-like cAMP-binding protein
LIVADEPTGNLDSKTADAIFALFAQLAAGGKTIVIVTHDADQARRVDRTILISDGKVVNEYLARALAVLDYDQLAEVARRVEPLSFTSGATIVRQGETGDKFYVILEGQVDVLIERPSGAPVLVHQLGRGEFFGEMALMGKTVRQATVRVSPDQNAALAALSAADFDRLLREVPVLGNRLARTLEERQKANLAGQRPVQNAG